MMLGFYILLRAFGISAWLAGLGGVIWAFSSYFFILIPAGAHLEVCDVGLYSTYDCGCRSGLPEEILVGRNYYSVVHRPSDSVESHSDELLFHVCDPCFLWERTLKMLIKRKNCPISSKASAILALAAVVGVCINISNLYLILMNIVRRRCAAKSELKQEGAADNETSSGLDRDYITNWSYGIGEDLTLLVPNGVKGGGSGSTMSQSRSCYGKGQSMYSGIYSQLPQYFGEQPWTAGPVYVGAFVMFLFVLGCFIVKGPLKWAFARSYYLLDSAFMGKEFHGIDGLLYRLRPDVQ